MTIALLFCTDGLHDYVREERKKGIILSAKNPQKAAEQLVEVANLAGGVDNIGVVITHIL